VETGLTGRVRKDQSAHLIERNGKRRAGGRREGGRKSVSLGELEVVSFSPSFSLVSSASNETERRNSLF